jgi:translation initiation factor 4B
MDLDTQRPKGYGYVEFLDRESLLSALSMDGESLQKRNIKINIAEGRIKLT